MRPRLPVTLSTLPRLRTATLLGYLACGCEPELVVGAWSCPGPDLAADGGAVGFFDKVVPVSWSTGFETDLCDYSRAGGFCYSSPEASITVVDTPVHGGRRAAAFSVIGDDAVDGGQARCFREGALPRDALYSAWFYVPSLATNTGNWNLMHFQGGAPGAFHGLWDVSLGSNDDGSLYLYFFDFLAMVARRPADTSALPVPVGAWFHVEFRLQRAPDETGEVAVLLDGQLVLRFADLVTDDSAYAQWYVGNLATDLDPAESTIYVDDVAISPP